MAKFRNALGISSGSHACRCVAVPLLDQSSSGGVPALIGMTCRVHHTPVSSPRSALSPAAEWRRAASPQAGGGPPSPRSRRAARKSSGTRLQPRSPGDDPFHLARADHTGLLDHPKILEYQDFADDFVKAVEKVAKVRNHIIHGSWSLGVNALLDDVKMLDGRIMSFVVTKMWHAHAGLLQAQPASPPHHQAHSTPATPCSFKYIIASQNPERHFPNQVHIFSSTRCVGWRKSAIDAWMRNPMSFSVDDLN